MNMFEAACLHCFKQARAILESFKASNWKTFWENHGLAHWRLLASTGIVRTPVPQHSRKQAGGKVSDNGGNPAKHGGITATLPSRSQLFGRLSLRFCCSSLRWLRIARHPLSLLLGGLSSGKLTRHHLIRTGLGQSKSVIWLPCKPASFSTSDKRCLAMSTRSLSTL